MNADGSGQTNLTNYIGLENYSDWSPDSAKIAFTRFVPPQGEGYEIYTMDADGTGKVNLTQSPESEVSPAWSPDGTQIAYTRFAEDLQARSGS